MAPENFSSKMWEDALTMLDQGRKEEAYKIFDMLRDTERVAELAASRVMEKLNVALVQEPALLSGVEEQVQWVQSKFMRLGVLHGYDFTEELMDVAYDFEDAIDDLVLRSAAKRRRRNWESCFLLIRINKKLENIKSKLPHLPPAQVAVPCSSETPKYLEEMEWSPMFSIATDQNLEKTVIYPLKEKLSALLDLKELHPDAKKRARRVLDQLESLASVLRGLKSADLNDKEMVWMETLSHVSLSGVDVIEDFIRNSAQLRKRSWIGQSFGKSKSHKFAMEMEQLCGKIQSLSISKPAKDDEPTAKVSDEDYSSEEYDEPNDLSSSNVEESATTELDFESFADDVHAMTTRLLAADKSFCVIPVMGVEGIGKKALAKLILNSKAVVQHFPFRAWPSRGDVRRILLDIVKQLMNCHMEVTRCSWGLFYEMMEELQTFLPGNRSLIVVVEPDRTVFMEELLSALDGTSNGSRLIWITREMSPPSFHGTRSDPHLLRLRNDEESWALFTHAIKVSPPSSELEKLKGNILRRSGGLPLLIVKLAEAFSHEDACNEELEYSISALEPEQSWSSILGGINKLSLYARRCLFSLTLFPENYDVPVRRLTTLWVAEDLLPTEGNHEAPEDIAERFLNLFIAQGMVQVASKKLNGNVKAVRLPDALRQHWLSKVQEAAALGNHIYTRSELFLGNDMIRRLVDHLDRNDVTFHHIHGGSHTSSTSLKRYYQDVISFRSFDTGTRIEPEEEMGKFLGRCISSTCLLNLWVLDLENVYKPLLPEAVGELTLLRYLGLRSTFLEKLPSSISKLRNLQTLDIKHTHLSVLPISIWKLQQLRHLYLNDGFRSRLMLPSSTGSLATLQTLCGLFIDEETRVRDGLNRVLNLRKLGLTMSSQVQAVTDWVLNLTHIRSLRVKSIDDDGRPCDLELKSLSGLMNLSYIFLLGRLRNPSIVCGLPISLVDLTLSWSQLTEDPMQSLGKLPNLKCLKLLAKSYVGKSMHCRREGFPQLRVLKLWKLDEVEEWKVEEGALHALRHLEIRYSERPLLVPQELLNRSPFLKIINVRLAS